MTKAELIENMAKDAGVTKVAAGAALESFMDGVGQGAEETKQQGYPGRIRHLQEGLSQNPLGTQSADR